MKFGFKTTTLITMGLFAFGFLFMLLNTVLNLFLYLSLLCFLGAFSMLTYFAYKRLMFCKREQRQTKIELLMEIATSDIGENYVLRDSPFSKAEEANRRQVLLNKWASLILCATIVAFIVFIFIKLFI